MAGSNPRGTSNTNDRGSAASRRERKLWLMSPEAGWGGNRIVVPCFRAETHCRSFGLTYEAMQVDRIRPGVLHGRYVKSNIRPVCPPCNFAMGIELREKIRRGEILVLDTERGNIVLFREGRQWVASAQQGGRVLAEARGTNRVNVLADLSVSLLERVIHPIAEEAKTS